MSSVQGAFGPLSQLLARGDLTCELSDSGLARALAIQWHVRLGAAAFIGHARTVDASAGDVPSVYAAASMLKQGEVLVVSTSGQRGAVLGGNLASTAVAAGAAGVIVDGLIRDVPQIEELGLNVRARGVLPARGRADGSGGVVEAVTVAGVRIASGDLVVVDASGVVIVPFARIPELEPFAAQALETPTKNEFEGES